MSDAKISEAAPLCPDCATPLLFECVGCSKSNYPQPAELAEQQGVDLLKLWEVTEKTGSMFGEHLQRFANVLAATGKQQVGEVVPATFDDGGDYYADQHGEGAWATYLRNGKGWVYNFGQGDDAEIRAKSVARELNRQVAAITARMQVGEVQGDALAAFNECLTPALRVPETAAYRIAVLAAVQAALAASEPGAQEPVGYLFTDDPAVYAMPGSGFHPGKEPPADAINVVPVYAAPPAQGIDLGQLRKLADRWERTANDKDVAFKDRELIGMYDKGLMKCVRELRAALIDQRDAAPGVGNG